MHTMRSRKIHLVLLASTAMGVSGCDNPGDKQPREQVKGETVQEELTFVVTHEPELMDLFVSCPAPEGVGLAG